MTVTGPIELIGGPHGGRWIRVPYPDPPVLRLPREWVDYTAEQVPPTAAPDVPIAFYELGWASIPLPLVLCGFSWVATSFAADAEPKEPDKTMPARSGKWSFEPAANPNPSLPRVLLIGDSIAIGYKAMVIKALAGKANVDVWPNPFFQSEKLNQQLARILKHGPYAVVHVNVGLHGVEEGRLKPGTFEPLTRAYIQVIRDTMPKAKIIWANTTQFTIKGKPTELDPVKNPTVLEHNRIAAKLIADMLATAADVLGGH